jgi:hypothetical protein
MRFGGRWNRNCTAHRNLITLDEALAARDRAEAEQATTMGFGGPPEAVVFIVNPAVGAFSLVWRYEIGSSRFVSVPSP